MKGNKYYWGIAMNPVAFPARAGETAEGVERCRGILADPFFDAVEAGWIKTPEYRKKVRRAAEESGKEIAYGCGPEIFAENLNINARDEAERTRAVSRLKQLADDAMDYGAKTLVFCGGPNVAAELKGEAFRFLVDSIGELCAFCREARPQKPLVVSLELFDSKIDKKRIIGSSADAALIARRVVKDHPNFSLTLDLSHLPLMGETAQGAVSRCRPFLQHAHVGNCVIKDAAHPLYGDKHPPFGIEGGEIGAEELAAFLAALDAGGYASARTPSRRPLIIAEVFPRDGENPLDVVKNIKETLSAAAP
ncbi:MAG TPA: TIM barrel protein [bacterium]|nr:TIM barrel protein [bacterium]